MINSIIFLYICSVISTRLCPTCVWVFATISIKYPCKYQSPSYRKGMNQKKIHINKFIDGSLYACGEMLSFKNTIQLIWRWLISKYKHDNSWDFDIMDNLFTWQLGEFWFQISVGLGYFWFFFIPIDKCYMSHNLRL